jgi:hypothetical protein
MAVMNLMDDFNYLITLCLIFDSASQRGLPLIEDVCFVTVENCKRTVQLQPYTDVILPKRRPCEEFNESVARFQRNNPLTAITGISSRLAQ